MSKRVPLETEQSNSAVTEIHSYEAVVLPLKKRPTLLAVTFLVGAILASGLYQISPKRFTTKIFLGVENAEDPARLIEESSIRAAFVSMLRNTELARKISSKTFEYFGTSERAVETKAYIEKIFSSGIENTEPKTAAVEGLALYLSTEMADLVTSNSEPIFTNAPFALLVRPSDATSWRMYLKLEKEGMAEEFVKPLMKSLSEIIIEYNESKRLQVRSSMGVRIREMGSIVKYSTDESSDKNAEFQKRKLSLRLRFHRFDHLLSEVEKKANIIRNPRPKFERITLAASDPKLDIEIGSGNNSIVLKELQNLEIDDLTRRIAVILENKSIPEAKRLELEGHLNEIVASLGLLQQQMDSPMAYVEKQIMSKFIDNLGELGSEKYTIFPPRFDLASLETQKLSGAFDNRSNLVLPIGFLGGILFALLASLIILFLETPKRRIG